MSLFELAVSVFIENPQVAPLTGLLILAYYHLKYGVVHDLQQDVHGLRGKMDSIAVIVYRFAKQDPETDANAVREYLWDDGDPPIPDDFEAEGRPPTYPPGTLKKADKSEGDN